MRKEEINKKMNMLKGWEAKNGNNKVKYRRNKAL
jgi:hypothetical protein